MGKTPEVINGFTISKRDGEWQAVKDGRVWFKSTDKKLVVAFAKGATY